MCLMITLISTLQCGNNVTECPPRPTYQDPDTFKSFKFQFEEPQLQFLRRFALYFAGALGAYYIVGIVVLCLVLLGALKVLLMLQSGQYCSIYTCTCISLVHGL